ncbi:MAG: LPXTG cell wall anchor domain-containing protein, partial [Ilumatobacteraceae bacterium]
VVTVPPTVPTVPTVPVPPVVPVAPTAPATPTQTGPPVVPNGGLPATGGDLTPVLTIAVLVLLLGVFLRGRGRPRHPEAAGRGGP